MPLARKQVFQLAKGFRGRAKNCIRVARQAVEKALQYQYISRRLKKRDARKLWIQRINAGTRAYGVPYNKFMFGLKEDNIQLDRKILCQLAAHEPYSFKVLVDRATHMAQAGLMARNQAAEQGTSPRC
mmetsp:Transcript_45571/g.87140  ORF Transcript_45571/g.87140 Transcript_45571/m.87140 type:complete len:128 (-) Transcript_45571:331-714(-)